MARTVLHCVAQQQHSTAQHGIILCLLTWMELHCCELIGLEQGCQAHVTYLQGDRGSREKRIR